MPIVPAHHRCQTSAGHLSRLASLRRPRPLLKEQMKFKSREDAIVKLLSKNANLLPEAASSFCGIAEAEIGTRAAQLKVLREVAAESDRRYLDLVRKVSASAIPPQDREGLHGLADSIDGVVGTLEGSGELLVEFELAELPAAFTRNSRRLYGMCELARDALHLVRKPSKIEKRLIEIGSLKKEMDRNYRVQLVTVLTPTTDPVSMLKMKSLLDSLDLGATRVEGFVRCLTAMAIVEG